MKSYDHKKIEKKWQGEWRKDDLYTVPDAVEGKENFFLLVEFPYPSGNLHVGHWYAFAVPDILSRTLRMQGKNVLFPIGFDAFGLPAENAAIKNKLNPRQWTLGNIAHMKEQIASMGTSFDWSRLVVTCEPEYYKWTQWLFLQFFKKDLVYRKETAVNWCPKDKTVLANEQVVAGKCERCGTEVEQRQMLQWNVKITDYADRLVDDLDALDWPEQIKESQRNWIGRSEGAEIDFKIAGAPEKVTVFTTRPDTLFGATYLVLAPEHPLVGTLRPRIKNWSEAESYIEATTKLSELDRQASKEKTGVELKGVSAINPATGEKIPLYIADYVLGHYGTGAIMAVPAHDERDYAFAKKFDLPIIPVIYQNDGVFRDALHITPNPNPGFLRNSDAYNDLPSEEAKVKITEKFGHHKTTYKLRDWVISRQRYWGVPIPIIHCPKCGAVAVPEKDLPVILPEVEDYLPSGDGKSPLAKVRSWVEVKCPKCKGDAERETDTFDTFVDSSWYFQRYTDPKNTAVFASPEKLADWMPVDLYSGGAEHTTMHVLYSRFWQKAMYDLGLVKDAEPYTRRMNRSLIMGPDGQKMSKSKGNVIDPDEVVNLLGADTVRLYLAFIGPYNEVSSYPWNPDGVVGVRRFLERVARIGEMVQEADVAGLQNILHKTIKKVGEDNLALKFNTSISQMMILVNAIEKKKSIGRSQYEILLRLLAPFAPHMAEELWHELGNTASVHLEQWPQYDGVLLKDDTVTIAVQVNGKTRGDMQAPADADKADLERSAREAVAKYLEGKTVSRVVVVPNRLVNFVLPE